MNKDIVILVQTLTLTLPAPDVGEPGQSGDKWATGTGYSWTRYENREVLECYYTSIHSETGYMQRMCNQWIFCQLHSNFTSLHSTAVLHVRSSPRPVADIDYRMKQTSGLPLHG